jgi:HTH-type transcriptional regulator/antitoxin HigA
MENIRPLKTEADYDWAIAEITKYFDNEPEVGSPDGDRFDVLADLIEVYEAKHYPIEAPDPVTAIRAHMEMAGLKQVALAEIIGSASRASEILNRKRLLTMDMAHLINKNWHIPAEVLIQPYRLADEEKTKGVRAPAAAG